MHQAQIEKHPKVAAFDIIDNTLRSKMQVSEELFKAYYLALIRILILNYLLFFGWEVPFGFPLEIVSFPIDDSLERNINVLVELLTPRLSSPGLTPPFSLFFQPLTKRLKPSVTILFTCGRCLKSLIPLLFVPMLSIGFVTTIPILLWSPGRCQPSISIWTSILLILRQMAKS